MSESNNEPFIMMLHLNNFAVRQARLLELGKGEKVHFVVLLQGE